MTSEKKLSSSSGYCALYDYYGNPNAVTSINYSYGIKFKQTQNTLGSLLYSGLYDSFIWENGITLKSYHFDPFL